MVFSYRMTHRMQAIEKLIDYTFIKLKYKKQ